MPPNGFESWQQARGAARAPQSAQYPASSSSTAGAAASSNGDGDGDADAAILAQIRALQARLSSSSSEHVAANIPSASSAQRRPTARPPVASSSSSRTSILAPASPPRAPVSASAAPASSSLSSSSAASYRGPQYMSSRAHTGVQELVRQAASAPRPRAPKPRPQWFLKHAQQRQEEAAQQKDLASSSTGLTRNDRLALMENMDLKPGPIDFGRGMHNDYEPYSGQRLRGGRLISHEDFNEIMTGRYFLSPSQLYSIRVPAIGRKKGADGDFDVPVPGDFVIIVTITNASDTIIPKEDEEDKMQETNARLVDEEEWLGSMGRSSNTSAPPPGGRGFQINSLDHRKPPKGPLRWFDLQDLSSRPVDGQSEGRGDCMLKLMVKKASHRDKETGEYSGGSRGAFEKLEAERSGGAVIAIVNPILLGDKKKGRPRKDGTEPTDVNASNSVMTIMARDAESLFIIGRCKDYASCTALKADGQKCKKFVDRRTSTCRGPALCDYHLDHGASRAHKGRQELANTTSSFFGGGGSIGYGGRGEDGEGRKKQTSGWAAWRAKKEGRGGRGGGYSSGGRPWEPRPPRTGDLTYGLEGGAISRQQFVVADTAQASLSHNDPQSQRFSVRDAYGREKEERELRKRKREEEGRVLRELERKRAGYVGLEGEGLHVRRGQEGDGMGTQQGEGEEAVPFTLPSHSTGALAIADAQKTLQERKAKAAKAAAAKAATASGSRKKSKTTAAASTATSRNNALRLDSDDDDDADADQQDANSLSQPFPSSSSSSQAHPQQSRWRHSASAIKLMGFDPLSDSRSRQNRNGSGSSSTDVVTSSLLRRHAASNADLPEARLSLKRGEKRRSGVRAPPVGEVEGRREGGAGVGGGGQQQVVEISDNDDGDDALEIV